MRRDHRGIFAIALAVTVALVGVALAQGALRGTPAVGWYGHGPGMMQQGGGPGWMDRDGDFGRMPGHDSGAMGGYGMGGYGMGGYGMGAPGWTRGYGPGMGPGGAMRPNTPGPNAPGPNAGTPNGANQPAIDEAAAKDRANAFLAGYMPGATVLGAQAFPGYYTFDYGSNGAPQGMLSVNATTGQIWPHTWHRAFIREME